MSNPPPPYPTNAAATAPPPGSRPPPYARVARMYRSSLRPVVIVTSLITAGWTLVWAVGAFQEINVDKTHGEPKFATLSIALGALYITACVIELFGVIAATMQSILLVRLFAFLSALSGLLIVAGGFIRTIVHFMYKSELISECFAIAQGQDVVFRFGIWGPTIREKLTDDEAHTFCNNWWSHDSFSEIVSLIIEIVIVAFLTSIAFAFYNQSLDPNYSRSRVPQPRADADEAIEFPQSYNPPQVPYDNSNAPAYAPPAGPPPTLGYGVGAGTKTRDMDEETLKGDDPFADFENDGSAKAKNAGRESRDTLL